MAGRITKRVDNRYTVTLTLDGKRRSFCGKTQAEAILTRPELRPLLTAVETTDTTW